MKMITILKLLNMSNITSVDELLWLNPFFYMFLIALGGIIIISSIFYKKREKLLDEKNHTQQQQTAKIDIIRREHSETLENITSDLAKREDDRNRQWVETEREVLNVLTSVSNILELTENVGGVETERIIESIKVLEEKIVAYHENKNGNTKGS